MSTGWIKLHRQLLEWEWYDDINTSRLFIHLMLTANHKDNNWRGIEIKRGSRLTSLDKLSKETGLSVSKIRTSIKKLISTSEIASKSHSQHTVFIMKNYDLYQGDDKQVSKRVTNESQTNDKRIATNNNVKNENNENKDITIDFVGDGFSFWWSKYPSARRSNKKGCLTKFRTKCKGMDIPAFDELMNKILADISRRVNTSDLAFIPLTYTYINQERWNDGE